MFSPQSTDRFYDPELSVLEKDGISLTSRVPEAEAEKALLFASALESGDVSKPLVFHTSSCAGLGLLWAREGGPQLSFPSFSPLCQTPEKSEKAYFSAEKAGFLLFDCGLSRKLTLPGPASYRILYIDGGISYFRKRLFQKDPCLPVPQSLGLHSELSLLFEPRQPEEIYQHLLLTRLLSGMVMNGNPAPRKPPAYLLEIRREFTEQYYQRHTLESLEEKYQINKYRICREFRHFFQTSPLQYLHWIRIQAARDMLLKTDMKIYEISYEIGYESVNHFIHHFRKFTGMTPAEYRERL